MFFCSPNKIRNKFCLNENYHSVTGSLEAVTIQRKKKSKKRKRQKRNEKKMEFILKPFF